MIYKNKKIKTQITTNNYKWLISLVSLIRFRSINLKKKKKKKP